MKQLLSKPVSLRASQRRAKQSFLKGLLRHFVPRNDTFYIILVYLFCAASVYAETEMQSVNKANKLYKAQKFDEALKVYNDGLVNFPNSNILNFNAGAAAYKKGDFVKAREHFSKSLATENKDIEAKASYNMGNALYKEAETKEKTDASGAEKLLKEGLPYFQRAIELNPKDQDAKFNYEVTDKKHKILLEKVKQEKQQCSTGRPQEGQKKEEKSQGAGNSQPATNASEGKQKTEEQKQEESKAEELKAREDKEKTPEDTQKPKEDKKHMSKEEAKMLIQAYGQEEGPRLELRDKHEPGKEREVLKDW